MTNPMLTAILSILGTLLTLASVVASVAQYKAANLQAQAAVAALLPQIEVRTHLEKVHSDKYTDRRIEITSDGGPVYNLRLEYQTWIEFKIKNKTVLKEALNGFYFSGYATGKTKGAIYTLIGHRNNEIYASFYDWRQAVLPANVDVSEPVTLIRLEYRDALKRENTEFVQVEGGNVKHLSNDEGELLWVVKAQRSRAPYTLDINDLKNRDSAAEWVKVWKSNFQQAEKNR